MFLNEGEKRNCFAISLPKGMRSYFLGAFSSRDSFSTEPIFADETRGALARSTIDVNCSTMLRTRSYLSRIEQSTKILQKLWRSNEDEIQTAGKTKRIQLTAVDSRPTGTTTPPSHVVAHCDCGDSGIHFPPTD